MFNHSPILFFFDAGIHQIKKCSRLYLFHWRQFVPQSGVQCYTRQAKQIDKFLYYSLLTVIASQFFLRHLIATKRLFLWLNAALFHLPLFLRLFFFCYWINKLHNNSIKKNSIPSDKFATANVNAKKWICAMCIIWDKFRF